MKDENQALTNSGSCRSSRFSSLLASGDRDYLFSPTGAQVPFVFKYFAYHKDTIFKQEWFSKQKVQSYLKEMEAR